MRVKVYLLVFLNTDQVKMFRLPYTKISSDSVSFLITIYLFCKIRKDCQG